MLLKYSSVKQGLKENLILREKEDNTENQTDMLCYKDSFLKKSKLNKTKKVWNNNY